MTTFLVNVSLLLLRLDCNEAIISEGVHRVFSNAGIAGLKFGDEHARTDKSISGEFPEIEAITTSSIEFGGDDDNVPSVVPGLVLTLHIEWLRP